MSNSVSVRRAAKNTRCYGDGVWCCEKGWKCLCPSFEMREGLSWGTVPISGQWLQKHKAECGGKLIQLVAPQTKAASKTVLSSQKARLQKAKGLCR